MAGIPDDKVQEVRDRVDIVDLIGRYVELRRQGANVKGLCPFHDERTPSFNVSPARKGYKCFGCGAAGDAIRFVEQIEGKSFPEAVRKLAEIYGVSLPQGGNDRETERRQNERDEAYALLRIASDLYREILLRGAEGDAGRAYQGKRRIDPATAESFHLGYAPAPAEAGWDRLTRTIAARRGSLVLAEQLGLVARSERSGSYYDRFRGRLMFPVIQPGGEVIGFSGRVVPPHETDADGNPAPKYVNSAESVLYHKRKTLYGLHAARQAIRAAGRAIIVEGNVDVVSMHQRGHAETVAPLGTALTSDHAKLLARFTEVVVMCFDGDAAGRKAAAAALPLLLEQDLEVRIVLLPDGEDPDSVEPALLGQRLERAQPALEVMMLRLAARAGTAIDARARALDRIVPLISGLPRASAQELYAQRAAELFGFPPTRLRAMLGEKSARSPSTSPAPVPVSAPVRPPSPLPAGQAQLTALLVDAPHLVGLAQRHGVLDHVTDSRLSPIVTALIDGAKAGIEPNLSDLLDLVEPSSQKLVFDEVFGGRDSGTASGLSSDPVAELLAVIGRCREERLEAEIHDVKRRRQEAERNGDEDELRRLVARQFELRSAFDDLRRRRVQGSMDPSATPEPTSGAGA